MRTKIFFAIPIFFLPLAAGAADPAAVTGEWALSVEFTTRARPATLELYVTPEGAFAGVWRGQGGEHALYDLGFADGTLTFSFDRPVPAGDHAVRYDFRAEVTGDRLSGELITPRRVLPVRGERVRAPPAEGEFREPPSPESEESPGTS